VAYAYADLRLSSSASTGDATRCLVWAGELIDTVKMGDVTGSDTLYLRIAGLRAGVWHRFYLANLLGKCEICHWTNLQSEFFHPHCVT
jgi:hypothetical protein